MVKATTAKPTDAATHLSEKRATKGESPPKLKGNCWENGEANMEHFRNMLETEGCPPKLSGNWCDVSSSSDWWKVQPKKWGNFTQQHRGIHCIVTQLQCDITSLEYWIQNRSVNVNGPKVDER